jgi:hypothetical protein
VRNTEQRADLTHGQVRPPVHRHQQHPDQLAELAWFQPGEQGYVTAFSRRNRFARTAIVVSI